MLLVLKHSGLCTAHGKDNQHHLFISSGGANYRYEWSSWLHDSRAHPRLSVRHLPSCEPGWPTPPPPQPPTDEHGVTRRLAASMSMHPRQLQTLAECVSRLVFPRSIHVCQTILSPCHPRRPFRVKPPRPNGRSNTVLIVKRAHPLRPASPAAPKPCAFIQHNIYMPRARYVVYQGI